MPSSFLSENHFLLNVIAEALGELVEDVVFVGGITTFLLIDSQFANIRKTEDVDVIVNITTKLEYYKFSDRLRVRGFREYPDDGVICRWIYKDIEESTYKLDVMPITEEVLGFSNKWYTSAIENHNNCLLSNQITIKVVDKPHFLATKFEAFYGRSNGDFYSHDMEDIVFVIEHSAQIMKELVQLENKALKAYLNDEFDRLVKNVDFLSILPGLLDADESRDHVLRVLHYEYV